MTDSASTFRDFLLWERASRDTLEVKRTYIDMAGDLVAGVLLSQIVYWHLPSREGKARLQVEREGVLWLAKSRADWWDECRISPKQADRALDVLKQRGLIEVRIFKFGNAPTKHVRIREAQFLGAWKAELRRSSGDPGPEGGSGPDIPQRSKSISTKGEDRILPKGKHPHSSKGKMDLPQRAKSLSTEITSETTAAARAEEKASPSLPTAAALLARELTSHGVSQAVATRYAVEKPDVCRRCIEYLPFAKFRTTKGAWLANAIRDEYGPPPGYEAARAKLQRQRDAETEAAQRNARQASEFSIRSEKAAKAKLAYQEMEQARGEAFLAFNEHVLSERAKTERIAVCLSPERREEQLAAFDKEEHRLEIFELWLKSQARASRLTPPNEPALRATG